MIEELGVLGLVIVVLLILGLVFGILDLILDKKE